MTEPKVIDPQTIETKQNQDLKDNEMKNENKPVVEESKDELKDDEKKDEYKSATHMNAIMCIAVGEKDFSKSIKCQTVPKPKIIKPDEVIIETYACAINPIDYKMAVGNLGYFGPNKPYIVGKDFCGIITKIGSNVQKYKIGDAVCGKMSGGSGSFCEFSVINVKHIHKIPSNMSFSQAAGISLVGLTSYEALVIRAKLKKTDKVLILGGSTSCGLMAIQIAKYFGCSIITVTSTQKELCESLGANQVINYRQSNWATELKGKGYNIIYDCIGGNIWTEAQSVMCDTGYFVTICSDDADAKVGIGSVLGMSWNVLKRKSSSWMGGGQKYDLFLLSENTSGFLGVLLKMFEEGKLKVIIDKSDSGYNMGNCCKMFEKSRSHTSHGKLIMKVKNYDDGKTMKELGLNQK